MRTRRSPNIKHVLLPAFIISGGAMDAQKLFRNAQKLFFDGNYQKSIAAFTKYIESGGKTEIAFLSRGVAYLKTEHIDKAIEDFATVLAMNSSNMRAYFYRGIAYMSTNDFERAIEDFDRTIKLKPDHGEAFFARGSSYAQIGNEYEAARNIKTAIMFSETNMQGFEDAAGFSKIQFDKARNIIEDMEKAPGSFLTKEEIGTVKKWLDERNQ